MVQRHTYNTGASGYLLEARKILMNDAGADADVG